jgi:hypothetical protein
MRTRFGLVLCRWSFYRRWLRCAEVIGSVAAQIDTVNSYFVRAEQIK